MIIYIYLYINITAIISSTPINIFLFLRKIDIAKGFSLFLSNFLLNGKNGTAKIVHKKITAPST